MTASDRDDRPSTALAKPMQISERGRRVLHRGHILLLEAVEIVHPDGHVGTYDVVSHVGAAAVVAIDHERHIYLVEQDRWAVGERTLELPAGRRDPGETYAACAARELTEEVGQIASELVSLGVIYTTPGFCSEAIGLYLADGLRKGAQHLDPHEELNVVRLPFAEALAMAEDGRIADAKTIVGIARAAAHLMPRTRK